MLYKQIEATALTSVARGEGKSQSGIIQKKSV